MGEKLETEGEDDNDQGLDLPQLFFYNQRYYYTILARLVYLQYI